MSRPVVVVAGLGPAGAELVPEESRRVLADARRAFVRTVRHPAVASITSPVESFDDLYDAAEDYETLYETIAVTVAEAAAEADGHGGFVAYGVPGSPLVAERTVALLRARDDVEVRVVLAPSFIDLAWERLGVDPMVEGVRMVDGADFAVQGAGQRGPLLVGHCHSRSVLSEIKLAVEVGPDGPDAVTVLHHLGLPDEWVSRVGWDELDRSFEPDHLTSLWIPELAAPVAGELVRLEELVRVLRARCPWDQRQSHGSLGRHLLEEAYEALDAIEAFSAAEPEVPAGLVAHLEEELGDLLFQVVFHAVLGAEEGRFTLADVARTVHDKLWARHPHVFGDAVADTPEQVAERWEQLKKAEKGRASVTDGIPDALPALALAAKLQRKAESVHMAMPGEAQRHAQVSDALSRLAATAGAGSGAADASGETLEASAQEVEVVGEALFALADAARRAGVDPETALRAYARRFRRQLQASE